MRAFCEGADVSINVRAFCGGAYVSIDVRAVLRVLSYDDSGHGDDWSLTRDGTSCGDNLVCINQTCTSIYVFIETGRCMTNNNVLECSGHGVSH